MMYAQLEAEFARAIRYYKLLIGAGAAEAAVAVIAKLVRLLPDKVDAALFVVGVLSILAGLSAIRSARPLLQTLKEARDESGRRP